MHSAVRTSRWRRSSSSQRMTALPSSSSARDVSSRLTSRRSAQLHSPALGVINNPLRSRRTSNRTHSENSFQRRRHCLGSSATVRSHSTRPNRMSTTGRTGMRTKWSSPTTKQSPCWIIRRFLFFCRYHKDISSSRRAQLWAFIKAKLMFKPDLIQGSKCSSVRHCR